jgi:hypothetical protein
MTTLERLRVGENVPLEQVAIYAVVSAASDRLTPLPDSPAIDGSRQRVRSGEFHP